MRINLIDLKQDEGGFYFVVADKKGQQFKVLIDEEDWPRILKGFRNLVRIFQIGGIPRICGRLDNETRNWEYLHRFLLSADKDSVVDHINHNPLDNRKTNLRILSKSGNTLNRRGATKRSQTGIRGVCWNKFNNNWMVQLQIDKKKINPRYFRSLVEAEKYAKALRARLVPESTNDIIQEAA